MPIWHPVQEIWPKMKFSFVRIVREPEDLMGGIEILWNSRDFIQRERELPTDTYYRNISYLINTFNNIYLFNKIMQNIYSMTSNIF